MRRNRSSFSFPDFSLRRLLLQGARAARGSPTLGSRCDIEKGTSSSSKGEKASSTTSGKVSRSSSIFSKRKKMKNFELFWFVYINKLVKASLRVNHQLRPQTFLQAKVFKVFRVGKFVLMALHWGGCHLHNVIAKAVGTVWLRLRGRWIFKRTLWLWENILRYSDGLLCGSLTGQWALSAGNCCDRSCWDKLKGWQRCKWAAGWWIIEEAFRDTFEEDWAQWEWKVLNLTNEDNLKVWVEILMTI